jgi:Cu(I)/Ag(I) efflux system membrane fusion protein
MRKLVYLARPNGVFEAREVMVGTPSQESYPVLGGLTAGDKVVVNGAFLIDSQTRLASGMSSMFGGSKQFSNVPEGASTAPPATANANAAIVFSVEPNPPKGAAENMFRVSLTDAAGKAIPDADVKVTLVMPAMPSMGMPEMRQSFALPYAGGVYAGKGNIPAAGPWNISVEASKGGQLIASFHTHVRAQ